MCKLFKRLLHEKGGCAKVYFLKWNYLKNVSYNVRYRIFFSNGTNNGIIHNISVAVKRHRENNLEDLFNNTNPGNDSDQKKFVN